MRKTSLVDAKAHLSALVDDAEHHRRGTVILRHGKPAAAIVPVDVGFKGGRRASSRARIRRTPAAIRRLFDRLGAAPRGSAVADLLESRR